MRRISCIYSLLLIILCSCSIDTMTYVEFIVKNESDYEVKIKTFFLKNGVSTDTVFNIPVGSEIKYYNGNKGKNHDIQEPFGGASKDITITFVDSVSIIYDRQNTSKFNLLRKENYLGGKVTNGLFRYIYVITNDDFEAAKNYEPEEDQD